MVRIFIASKDSVFRMALQLLLESEPGMVVIGTSDREEGLAIIVKTLQPEVLLMDYELADHMTIDLIREVRRLECQPKIIIFSIDPQVKEMTLTAGAVDFINKNYPPDKLLPILRDMRLSATTV